MDVDIILSKISENTVEDLRVRCINAFDIKIGDIESMFGFYVEIEDIRSRQLEQLEGGTYRVVEQEEGAFSFYCDEFCNFSLVAGNTLKIRLKWPHGFTQATIT